MCFNPIKLLIHRSEENSLIPEIDELGVRTLSSFSFFHLNLLLECSDAAADVSEWVVGVLVRSIEPSKITCIHSCVVGRWQEGMKERP